MCRLAAYLGPPIGLEEFILSPDHSLYRQSWQSREMAEAVINADGFGFVWWNEARAESYINTRPIWSDSNLPSLARNLASHGWLACVRSATPGQSIHEGNTQPFISSDGWAFMHNGLLGGFHKDLRESFHRHLPAETFVQLQGDCDSEYWFMLLRRHMDKEDTIPDAMRAAGNELQRMLPDKQRALLNTVLSDGKDMFICRHALHDKCPSLYYRIGGDGFSGAAICASEPFDQSDSWQAVPEHSVLHLRAGEIVSRQTLD